MALNELYFLSPPLNQYLVDKDSGLPLSNGTLTFYRDTARSTLKPVYELTGVPPNYTYTSLGTSLTLSGSGVIVNGSNVPSVIYFYPYDAEGNLDLYYVECRNSAGTLQWTREAWPNITAATNPADDGSGINNQLSNSQFTRVFINEGATTYTVSGAVNENFKFAPDWEFYISGTGTVTIQQISIAGNDQVITNPPYVLDINISSGITLCELHQRLNVNSGLWSSTDGNDIYLAGTFIARNENAGTTSLDMYYEESVGSGAVQIISQSFDNSDYQVLRGTTLNPIPLSTNTSTGTDGYVDIYVSFSANSHVRISSLQVVPTADEAGGDVINYQPNSSNREQAAMGDYYIPALQYKATDSLLELWQFPSNPAQFGASGTITSTPGYIWDQTIAASATGNVAYSRNAATGALSLSNAGATEAVYLLQYQDQPPALSISLSKLSSLLKVYATTAASAVTMRVYLFRGNSSSSIPTLPTTIGTIATTGVFTLTASNWFEIDRGGMGTPIFTLTAPASSDLNEAKKRFECIGWDITDIADINVNRKFAMVVTFAMPSASSVVNVESVSLNLAELPTEAAPIPMALAQSIAERYYEKTYPNGIAPGTVTYTNARTFPQFANPRTGTTISRFVYNDSLCIVYRTPKRTLPSFTVYNPNSGASAAVAARLYVAGALVATTSAAITGWTLNPASTNSVSYFPYNAAPLATSVPLSGVAVGELALHYVADARYGIV